MEKAAAKSVDEYLARVPEPARASLQKVRAAIRSAAPPNAVECISYRIPMFKHKGMLIGFAAFADHGSLFPGGCPTSAFRTNSPVLKHRRGQFVSR